MGETFAFSSVRGKLDLSPGFSKASRAGFGGKEVLDAAHWVGAITRSVEGSYMQLRVQICRSKKAVL